MVASKGAQHVALACIMHSQDEFLSLNTMCIAKVVPADYHDGHCNFDVRAGSMAGVAEAGLEPIVSC